MSCLCGTNDEGPPAVNVAINYITLRTKAQVLPFMHFTVREATYDGHRT